MEDLEEVQKYCLKWEHHRPTVLSECSTLFQNGKLVDVTLAAEGKRLKAHRLVLSACSPYFEMLLDEEYNKYPIVILRDVKFQALEAVVDFMYKGEVDIAQDQIEEFLKVAKLLQIKGLDRFEKDQPLTNGTRGPDDEEFPVAMSPGPPKKQRLMPNLDNEYNDDASNSFNTQSLTQDISSRTALSTVDITMEPDMPNIMETELKIPTQSKDDENSRPITNKDNLINMQIENDKVTPYLAKKRKLGQLLTDNEEEGQIYLTAKQVLDPRKNTKNMKIFIGERVYTMKMSNHQLFI